MENKDVFLNLHDPAANNCTLGIDIHKDQVVQILMVHVRGDWELHFFVFFF